jgi:hypothetical protein
LGSEGRVAEAEALCRSELVNDPASVEARCMLATVALQTGGGGARAAPWLHQSCALQPSYAPVHYYLALQRYDRGDVSGGRSSARRALMLLDPTSRMAGMLRTTELSRRWLYDRRPFPLSHSRAPAPAGQDCQWLFVWRDLNEFLFHFDRAHGHRTTL